MVAQFSSIESAPSLRPMRLEDIDRVTVIEQESYDYPWTAAIFRDCLRANYDCWVLVQANELIGYGVLAAAAGEAHVLNICIARAAQGEGHGRHLMRRLIDLARWHHAARIFLEVRPSNTCAIALYFNLGFNEISHRPDYYPTKHGREDAIVMALELFHDSE